MENIVEKMAVTILLELLKDSRRAKKMLPALRKVYNALALFFGPEGVDADLVGTTKGK